MKGCMHSWFKTVGNRCYRVHVCNMSAFTAVESVRYVARRGVGCKESWFRAESRTGASGSCVMMREVRCMPVLSGCLEWKDESWGRPDSEYW